MRFSIIMFLFFTALTLGAQSSSNFDDQSTQGWDNGNSAPDPTVQSGGAAGPTDFYLRVVADGNGAGGRLAVFNNTNEWTGNYLAANIGAIELSAANFSNQDLEIRVVLESNTDRLVSSESLTLNANDDSWQSLFFTLSEDNLVGTADYTTVLSNVTKVWIMHGGTTFPGPLVNAEIGIDNVRQELKVSSTRSVEQDIFTLQPLGQPALTGQAALMLNTDQAGQYTAEVFNLNGQKVLEQQGNVNKGESQRVALSELQAGNYVVHFSLSGTFGRSTRSVSLLVR